MQWQKCRSSRRRLWLDWLVRRISARWRCAKSTPLIARATSSRSPIKCCCTLKVLFLVLFVSFFWTSCLHVRNDEVRRSTKKHHLSAAVQSRRLLLSAWLSVSDVGLWLADFPWSMMIYGWQVTTSWVRCPLWVNQPGQLSLPSPWDR